MSVQLMSVTQLAAYLQVTKRTVQRNAISKNWPFTEHLGRGGNTRLYSFSTLPNAIKAKIIAGIIGGQEKLAEQNISNCSQHTKGGTVTSIVLTKPLDPQCINKTYVVDLIIAPDVVAVANEHAIAVKR